MSFFDASPTIRKFRAALRIENRRSGYNARQPDRPALAGENTPAPVRTRHESKTISSGTADGSGQRSAAHFLHSATVSGDGSVPTTVERMIPSDVEQKLRTPALLEAGVAVTT
jgi:hypothetical protein